MYIGNNCISNADRWTSVCFISVPERTPASSSEVLHFLDFRKRWIVRRLRQRRRAAEGSRDAAGETAAFVACRTAGAWTGRGTRGGSGGLEAVSQLTCRVAFSRSAGKAIIEVFGRRRQRRGGAPPSEIDCATSYFAILSSVLSDDRLPNVPSSALQPRRQFVRPN